MRKTLVLLIVALALMASGCFMTGGGFIDGEEEGTANFGFNVKCDGEDTKGNLTYHDGDLKIKGTVDKCTALGIMGTYVAQGKSVGGEGTFLITGLDLGEPGVYDYFTIKLVGPDHFFYMNAGELLGGNIQWHM